MQTCSICHTQSPDSAQFCKNCQADLQEKSTLSVALKRYQENSRVSFIRISICADACPVCYELMGTYEKDQVPHLPVENCSHNLGCRCFYEPVLDELFP